MKKPSVKERYPRIIEMRSSRECCVNFRLEFDTEGYNPSIIGSIGETHGDQGDWNQVFYVPLPRYRNDNNEEKKRDLEQSAMILERVAIHLRLEGKKFFDSVEESNKEE